ncbi:MAG: hypothetical protein GY895_09275 [Phycisphaera sp.]|nr:hypothetical protein [Phycisphaera sp.]
MGGAEVFLIVLGLFGCVMILAVLGLYIWSLLLLMKAADSVPQEHRLLQPGFVFLMLIPLFSVAWAFFMTQRLSRGMESSFASRGVDRGDCGRVNGLVFATLGCIGTFLSIFQSAANYFVTTVDQDAGGTPVGIAVNILGCFSLILSLVGMGFYVAYVIRVHKLGRELRIQPVGSGEPQLVPPTTAM